MTRCRCHACDCADELRLQNAALLAENRRLGVIVRVSGDRIRELAAAVEQQGHALRGGTYHACPVNTTTTHR